MKYIKRLNENFTDVKESIEQVLANVTDIIGTDKVKINKNGSYYALEIDYNININGIADIIESQKEINTILEESMSSIEKLTLYYDISYNLFETKYHNNFARFTLRADIKKSH